MSPSIATHNSSILCNTSLGNTSMFKVSRHPDSLPSLNTVNIRCKSDLHTNHDRIVEKIEPYPFPIPSKSIFPQPLQFLWFKNEDSGLHSAVSELQNPDCKDGSFESKVEKSWDSPEPQGAHGLENSSSSDDIPIDSHPYAKTSKPTQEKWDSHMFGFHSLWRGFRPQLNSMYPSLLSSSILDNSLKKVNQWALPHLAMWKNESSREPFSSSDFPESSTSLCSGCHACQVDYQNESGVSGDLILNLDAAMKSSHSAESIQPFIHSVGLSEIKKIALLAELCDMAYFIPLIHPGEFHRKFHLQYVTSSIATKRKQISASVETSKKLTEASIATVAHVTKLVGSVREGISPVTNETVERKSTRKKETAIPMTTAEEDLTALSCTVKTDKTLPKIPETFCPCEWFICDDEHNFTRYFVIQGSDSLASWQTNITFDPVAFEPDCLGHNSGVKVHRGIYQAAEALYVSLLPHIKDFVHRYGSKAKLQFTGHSLGGSLATLLNLMLHIRGEVHRGQLLPIFTYGSPSIMCGGDYLLQSLGLSPKYLKQIMMHRDLVPRAFACDYPDHIAEVLRQMNGSFKDHPCLLHQKLMYAPMGAMLVLQPEAIQSPSHPLLPEGPALYHLRHPLQNDAELPGERARCEMEVRAAQRSILNNPHPLEILADPGSYGTDGSISRDHDPRNYARALNRLVQIETKLLKKLQRKQRRRMWMPVMVADIAPNQHQDSCLTGRNISDVGKRSVVSRIGTGRRSLQKVGLTFGRNLSTASRLSESEFGQGVVESSRRRNLITSH